MIRKLQLRRDTQRCPDCASRTRHTVIGGPLQHDPKYPEDRRFDFRTVTYRCDQCGRREQRQQIPNLLVDVFHV